MCMEKCPTGQNHATIEIQRAKMIPLITLELNNRPNSSISILHTYTSLSFPYR